MIRFGKLQMQVEAMYPKFTEFSKYFRMEEREDILKTTLGSLHCVKSLPTHLYSFGVTSKF